MPHHTEVNVRRKTDKLISLMTASHATIAVNNGFDRELVEIIGTVITPEVCFRLAHVMLAAADQQDRINELEAEIRKLRNRLDALTN